MLVVTLTATERPAYLRQVLEALRRCDGIDDVLLLPHVEPGNAEVRALIEAVDFTTCTPTWNAERLGVNRNTQAALADGFARAPFVVHLEDDIVPAADFLRFMAWAGERYIDEPGVFSVTGYNRLPELPPEDAWHRVERRCWLHPWSWLTWRDRWAKLGTHALWRARQKTWDCYVNEVVTSCKLQEVYAVLSRVQNIGLTSSLHTGIPEAWFAEHHMLKHWAGQVGVPAGVFAEAGEEESRRVAHA